ncbi:hypothetical protein GOP47_0019947 [Adiantum capillus-veneris]|uniref:Cilia- and flagella-associated protein 157 n=1 Tax=Adiantum capillus-veneris TaxID=13818 RepID=A0A9D4UCH5_ADICA|nr:hypothetical protein GOP47_0019947 [Adiantum capillus-veneris]
MPPKRKEGDSKDDNDGDVQSLLLEKDLEIETLVDKISRLEKRSQLLANDTEKQQATTNEMEEKLQDVIACLSSELKNKQSKVYQLEEAFNDVKAENMKAIENLTKDMHELKSTHKFVTEDLRLQLVNAEVQLRDIDEFRKQKAAIEQEIASLKEQLEREKKEHQDAISDTERLALQEKQRLRKEMLARIEETKMQMLQHMDEQLDAKTKKIIADNDQLAKELGYHMRQTGLLLQKNERLMQENVELHRQVLLAKEVEDDLAKRNLVNQRTIRILLYKFQEGIHDDKPDDQQRKMLEGEHRKEDRQRQKELEQIKSYIQEQTRAVELVSGADEAMRFLYACLDDIEVENVSGTQEQAHCATDLEVNHVKPPELPCSLDKLTTMQRQKLLMNLLRTAVSLRALTQNPAVQKPCRDLFSLANCGSLHAGVKGAVSVEDILSLSVEGVHNDEFECGSPGSRRVVSVGVQTDALNLEERLALEIKERLRPCSSLAIVT